MKHSAQIILVSNVFSHHQKPVSDALYRLTDGQFAFIETLGLTQELKNLGYQNDTAPPYLYHYDSDNAGLCGDLIQNADAVIFGGAPEHIIRDRIKDRKLVIRCSERPLKNGKEALKYIPRFIKWHWRNPIGSPIYLLCASGFAAEDYAAFGLFRNKSYKWGYFPPTRRYRNLQSILEKKQTNHILWCGRFLNLKHPDHALYALRQLKDAGVDCYLDYIGTGPLETRLHLLSNQLELQDRVRFLGTMSPSQVRDAMEKAGIFLLTSDRREGWGAVINESMNSACAVVASQEIGSVPFLIRDGNNGVLYPSGEIDTLANRLKALLMDPGFQQRLGESAYNTIINDWNADSAAERLIQLVRTIQAGDSPKELFYDGPCSRV